VVFYLVLFLALLGVDLATKAIAVSTLHTSIILCSFLRLRLIFNSGVGLGLLTNSGVNSQLVLIIISSLLVLVVACFAMYRAIWLRAGIIPEIMVCAGGIGNVISRIFYGGVADFLELAFYNGYSSILNIADIYIGVGFGIILLRIFYHDRVL